MRAIHSTPAQRQKIGYLITRLSLAADIKEELIYLYTDGRSTSVRDLQFNEAEMVIKALVTGAPKYFTPKEKMVRKILSMAHEMNWELPSGKVDMARVDNWCTKYGHLHKRLNLYSERELPQLVTAFQEMYLKHIKGI